MLVLNKIILTFSGDEEAYQYKDHIVTKSGKKFKTLKDFIKYYTNRKVKAAINIQAVVRGNLLRHSVSSQLEEYRLRLESRERRERERAIKRKEKREKERRETDIKTIMSYMPDISREDITKMYDVEECDIVNTMCELGY